MAKSLVMKPPSIVSTQTASRAWQNFFKGSLLSNFARCSSPRVQAKIEASIKKKKVNSEIFFFFYKKKLYKPIGLVEVSFPC